MYNAVLSLFFKCGIKCENHSAAQILIKKLFNLNELSELFKAAKEERIDKQYYVTSVQANPASKGSAEKLLNLANRFVLELISFKGNLKKEEIGKIRENFNKII